MKLLIVTQAVDLNDPILGFFHSWLLEFSKHFDSVIVLCLREGDHKLPSHVSVYSLGKNEGKGRITYLVRFFTYIWKYRGSYDAVFVHMNPEYVALGGILWRALGKRVGLWYLHKSVTPSLRIAALLSHILFTAAPTGIRLQSMKKRVVGHGIDVERFTNVKKIPSDGKLRVLTVGRIAPVKNVQLQLDALAYLATGGTRLAFTVVGGPATSEDAAYERQVREKAAQLPFVTSFLGSVTGERLPQLLAQADVFLNTSRTGGVDKAVLEAMVAGVPVVTTNDAFLDILPGELMPHEEASAIAGAIKKAAAWDTTQLRYIVLTEHALEGLVIRMREEYERLSSASR